jgi:hypothetical protein
LRVQVTPQDGKGVEAICFFAKRELGTVELAAGEFRTMHATLERDTFTKGQPVRLRLLSVT